MTFLDFQFGQISFPVKLLANNAYVQAAWQVVTQVSEKHNKRLRLEIACITDTKHHRERRHIT